MIAKIKYELRKSLHKNKIGTPESLIQMFRERLLECLEENITGIYLTGSYAIDDFDPKLSDLDFVVLLKRDLDKGDLELLRNVHREIEDIVVQPNLNGIYLAESSVGGSAKDIATLVEYHVGQLRTLSNKSSYYAINPIMWAELALHGITIHGKASKELFLKADWRKISDYMHDNINSYWQIWLAKSGNIFHLYYYLTLIRRNENAWCVCGVARQLYTLKENKITSKKGACEYWKKIVPERFHPILIDALNYRSGVDSRSAWKQKRETMRFLAYSIEKFNEIYAEKYN